MSDKLDDLLDKNDLGTLYDLIEKEIERGVNIARAQYLVHLHKILKKAHYER